MDREGWSGGEEAAVPVIALEGRDINEVQNLGWLLRHWSEWDKSNPAPERASRSPFGNINIAATPYASPSLLLPASDPNFFIHVEPGIRALVRACLQLDLFTYTSCEGHLYSASEADERHVGMVMRNAHETQWLLSVWSDVAEELNSNICKTACELAYMDHRLTCSGRLIRALDLYIVKRRGRAWNAYFSALEDVTSAVVASFLEKGRRSKRPSEDA